MGQRFDLKDTCIAPCQNLHVIKQFEDESIDAVLQRVMNVATDGYGMANSDTLQHVAAEAFLSVVATIVLNKGPTSIQSACQRIKTLIANKRAVYRSRVSFQESAFTLEVELRVSRIEKALDAIQVMSRGSTPSPSRQYRSRSPDPSYYPNEPR